MHASLTVGMACSSSLPWRHLQHTIDGPTHPFPLLLVVRGPTMIVGLLPFEVIEGKNHPHWPSVIYLQGNIRQDDVSTWRTAR
ncbi:unnamed protein product [Spirodela intermedia]|uniref:Uncharacterized protein n=1 Tax=Spirodela intermedia TaxID=51605 RepID=A0A7I8JEG5_SPIIN|nr:unnamed protein product [Spirodela intermedia]CAA6668536.1 unnamed protein product [Spirodela intermedia]